MLIDKLNLEHHTRRKASVQNCRGMSGKLVVAVGLLALTAALEQGGQLFRPQAEKAWHLSGQTGEGRGGGESFHINDKCQLH